MKRTKLINITIIQTIILITGCSKVEPKVENKHKNSKISIYNIMGISEKKEEHLQFVVTEPIPIIKESVPTVTQPPYVEEVQDIEFISYREEQPNAEKILNDIEWNAKRFLGTPYVWGATGPNKFDCSGFTQWVYRDVGITIPRVSRDQARVGEYISYQNLKRGDMVFFDTKKHRSGKVTHVGIYLGDGNFIHASSAGKKVVIYNFNEKEFYKKRFLWGRRVTNNNIHYVLN
jgi:hypothetical protein